MHRSTCVEIGFGVNSTAGTVRFYFEHSNEALLQFSAFPNAQQVIVIGYFHPFAPLGSIPRTGLG